MLQYVEHLAHAPLPMMGDSTAARRRGGGSSATGRPSSGGAFAKKRCWPKRGWRRYRSWCPLASRSMGSLRGGMPRIASSDAAAVRAGRWGVPSSRLGSWTTRNSPHGRKRSGISGSSASRGPLQTNDSGRTWCGRSKARAIPCRLRSVSSPGNGTIGTNPRSMFWAQTYRYRHSQS